nr:unnamed protein product [Digitaria exilis]
MSMIDLLTRVDAICKKYERYDADKHRGDGDRFSCLYAAVDAEIDDAIEKSARAAKEKNRAASVTLNADVQRTKARLLEEVVKLEKIAATKVKGLSPEEKVLRADLVAALPHRIQAIPDNHDGGATDQNTSWSARPGIKCGLQDEGLDFISEGLDTLKNLAEDMNEVDKANLEMKRTNVRLKQTVNQFRSTRNFTIDIILICIILGIATYLYNILSQ